MRTTVTTKNDPETCICYAPHEADPPFCDFQTHTKSSWIPVTFTFNSPGGSTIELMARNSSYKSPGGRCYSYGRKFTCSCSPTAATDTLTTPFVISSGFTRSVFCGWRDVRTLGTSRRHGSSQNSPKRAKGEHRTGYLRPSGLIRSDKVSLQKSSSFWFVTETGIGFLTGAFEERGFTCQICSFLWTPWLVTYLILSLCLNSCYNTNEYSLQLSSQITFLLHSLCFHSVYLQSRLRCHKSSLTVLESCKLKFLYVSELHLVWTLGLLFPSVHLQISINIRQTANLSQEKLLSFNAHVHVRSFCLPDNDHQLQANSMGHRPFWDYSHSTGQKIPRLYGPRKFITVFTTARHWSLYWTRCVQSTPCHPPSLRSTLILSPITSTCAMR